MLLLCRTIALLVLTLVFTAEMWTSINYMDVSDQMELVEKDLDKKEEGEKDEFDKEVFCYKTVWTEDHTIDKFMKTSDYSSTSAFPECIIIEIIGPPPETRA